MGGLRRRCPVSAVGSGAGVPGRGGPEAAVGTQGLRAVAYRGGWGPETGRARQVGPHPRDVGVGDSAQGGGVPGRE